MEDLVSENEQQETVAQNTENAFSEDSFSDEEATDIDSGIDAKKKKRKKRLIILSVIAGIIVILIGGKMISNSIKNKAAQKDMYTDAAVERKTITNSITGSSSIEPNDSYNVTTIKSGDITNDYFKEGDTVKKGDKLYQFDDKDAKNSLSSAQNALIKAEQAYVDAVKQRSKTISANDISTKSAQNSVTKALNSLNDAQNTFDDQYVKTEIAGKVKDVKISEKESVNMGAEIATVYDDSYMKLRLPFNENDSSEVYVGAAAEVSVAGSGDTLYGTVTDKSSSASAAEAHTKAVYVTIEVPNPGALTESDSGSAVVGSAACSNAAKFEYRNKQKITSKSSGTVNSLSISEGDSVYAGEQIAYIKSDNSNSALSNARLSYDDALLSLEKQVQSNDTYSQDSSVKNAKLALDDAKLSLEKAQDSVDDYIIEAPIEGTVVTKNAKSGDTIDSGGNNTEALCVIYDLSCVKLSIDVDETEIALVKTGQKATVTADAVDGEFEGTVVKVPVDGVNENGVTTYTIEVQIDDYGDLLPGMNVDAKIVVEQADNVLAVPVNSVNRGNIVFVKDDGQQHENDVTDIINRKENKEDKNQNKNSKNSDDGNNADSQRKMPEGENQPPAGTDDKLDTSGIPGNVEVPEGYRAILVETGINDNDYIEIKSGLTESDTVRTLNTEASSAGASFGSEEEAMRAMQQNMGGGMSGGMGGGMSGGMSGGAPGGMGGGSRGGMR